MYLLNEIAVGTCAPASTQAWVHVCTGEIPAKDSTAGTCTRTRTLTRAGARTSVHVYTLVL